MDRKTQIAERERPDDAPDVASNFRQVMHDLLMLGELQSELLKLDAQRTMGRLVPALAVIAIAALLLLGTVPVLLTGASHALLEYTDLPGWACHLIVASAAVFVAVISGVGAWFYIKERAIDFERSAVEFKGNLKWLKGTLSRDQWHDAASD